MVELLPAFSGSRQWGPAFLQLADHPQTHEETLHCPFRPERPSLPDETLNFPQIQIQPPSPKNAPTSNPTLPTMTTATIASKSLANGSSNEQCAPYETHNMNGFVEKKQNVNHSTEAETAMPSSHSSDEYSSEDGARTGSPIDVNSPSERPRHSRKASIPLAPPFMVSAPGKVIVYGEHAVVHGKVRHLPPQPRPWNSR